MSSLRAFRLARTFGVTSVVMFACDTDRIFNGFDLLTFGFFFACIAFFLKGIENA